MLKKTLLKEIGEFSLIDRIEQLARSNNTSPASVIAGIGDDAAVVEKDSEKCLLITADCLVENIHFRKDYTSAFMLGRKCLAVNLSDIAAMGGKPLYYIVCLSTPPSTPLKLVKDIYAGMNSMAKKYSLLLVGGDTVSSRKDITISVTVIGEAEKDLVVFRKGAKYGDNVFITGFPGDSALGLELLKKGFNNKTNNSLIKKHLCPVPRIEAGQVLSRLRIASSMIDISDGIASDMRHIINQSRVGARIFTSSFRLSKNYKKYCSRKGNEEYFYPALCGGEDYELLFTASPEKTALIKTLEKELGIAFTCIGEITEEQEKLEIIGKTGKTVKLKKEGFAHF